MTTDDVRAVAVQTDKWHFKEARSVKDAIGLAENPIKVHCMVIGRLSSYSGLFLLYQMDTDDQLTLGFLGFDEAELADPDISLPTPVFIPLRCPPGAKYLAVAEDATNSNGLFIGGQNLCYYTAQEALSGVSSNYRVLSRNGFLAGTKQLHVAQEGENVTLWALNGNSELVYQQFTFHEDVPVARTPVVPLLSELEGGNYFSALYNMGNNQKLFCMGKEDQVIMLMQDDNTRFWTKQLISIPTLNNYVEFQSYTTQIRMTLDGIVPMPNMEVCLSCSAKTILTINGSMMLVGSDPIELKTNECGILTIIAQANDLSAPTYLISDAPSSSIGIAGGSVSINAMSSVSEKLGSIKSAGDLKDLRLEDGTPLLQPNAADDSSLNDAADAIQELHKSVSNLPLHDSSSSPDISGALITSEGNPTQRSVWDFWPWLSKQLASARSWALEKLKKGFKFVIKLAKGVWEFVVDTAVKAYKAVTKVFEAIGAGVKKLLQVLGDLFNWSDIIDTKNVLTNVLNLGMLWGHEQIDGLKRSTHDFFEEQKDRLASLDLSVLPENLKSAQVGTKKAKAKRAESDATNKKAEGPMGNFGSYQLDHGDTGIQKTDDDHQVGDVFGNLIRNLKAATEKLKKLFTKLWANIKGLFKDSDVSIEQLLIKLGVDLAGDVLNILQSVAIAIIEVLADLFAQLAIQGNKTRKFPVLSALYRRLTGSDLSIIDVICLVLAIPATLSFKAISGGKKPKDVAGISEFLERGKYWTQIKSVWKLNDDGTPQNRGSEKFSVSKSVPALHIERQSTVNIQNVSAQQRNASKSPHLSMHPSRPFKTNGTLTAVTRNTTNVFVPELDRLFMAAAPFFKMIIPGIGAGWFLWYTFPGWFVDKGVPSKFKGTIKTVYYALTWFLSLPHVPNDAVEQSDRRFVHLFGLSQVFTGFMPQEFAAVVVGGTSFFQIITLVWLQIKTGVRKKTYSVTLALEEWIIVLGKLVGSIAALSQGVEPISCVGGFTLVMGGYAIKTSRITGLTDKMVDCSVSGL